ncbi:MAG: GNAT family N-acetyltransferase [Okeania sp. SIO3I5]|uniref:GNAT family N-acetyltransferase n=1 Tax=Okeania sp. SIO3I5 TaxID=2607805 RepID=UPI0013BD553C|nr:GNAT family N-acetyltransferase [Okeania sp. SIO3I5]NEQ35807.1 GNAT family N-acetyltransferase [Okeania sp. SIO3I5]
MVEVQVRLARTEDREAVLAFCQNTWENKSDYIHLVWDQWFSEPKGRIFVAVVNEVPVGIGRVFMVSDSEAWWEGLRVDRAYRGQGIARILNSQIEEFLRENNIKTSRCIVRSEDQVMLGMMARRNRKIISYYIPHRNTPISTVESLSGLIFTQLNNSDFNSAWELVNSSEFYGENNCFYIGREVKWQKLKIELFKNLIERGLVWGIKQSDRLVSLAIQSALDRDKEVFWLGYIRGTKESLPILLLELRHLAFQKKYSSIGGFFPTCELLLNYLEKGEFWKSYTGVFSLFEWDNLSIAGNRENLTGSS